MSKESKANNSGVKEEKNKQAMNRRKLLGSLAVVGGVSAMPTNWVKPVINSVFLPAHAQTSETPALTLSATSFDVSTLQGISDLDFVSTVISSAPAIASGGFFDLNATDLGGGDVALLIDFTDSDGTDGLVFINSLSPGQTSQSDIIVDSEGFVFSLDVSLSPDGNTLNLSLIL